MPEENKDKTQEEIQEHSTEETKMTKFKGASGVEHEIPADLYEDIKKSFTAQNNSIETKYSKQLESMNSKYSELEVAFRELQKSQLSAEELKKMEDEERQAKWNELEAQNLQNKQKYENYRVKNEVQAVVNKYSDKFISPQHMIVIAESILKPQLKNDMVMVGDETFETAFKKFVELEENKALLKATLTPGAGSPAGVNQITGKREETWDPEKARNMSPEELNKYMDKFHKL